ncbi:MAG: serine/threonine protein kinase [Deltaproteobacteria bacterium]|nr:serine/threonine protein kinase [Deltaproteobacteria bacterium]
MKGREQAIGERIAGKYELLERAGEGGMAVVWRGLMHGAAGFSRPVAMKQIKPELRHDQRQIAMFVEEARLGSCLLHPNIAQVLDFVDDRQGALWLVTEWVDGLDLGSLLRYYRARHERIPWPLAAHIGVGALRGLAAAHERHGPDGTPVPIVHRDVSPQNILLGVGGTVKLSDFGLARARDRTSVLTSPGFIKGKLGYLAPELVGGMPASPQSDIFAMGSVLWEALSGRPLFSGKNDREVLRAIHRGQVASVGDERPGLPKVLVLAVGRALGRTPIERYPSAAAMAQDLEGVLAGALMSNLEIQMRLGRAVSEARDRLSRRHRRPESRSTLRMQVRKSRLDMTRRSRE